jgi:hypothetical protein
VVGADEAGVPALARPHRLHSFPVGAVPLHSPPPQSHSPRLSFGLPGGCSFSALELEDTRIAPAALHGLCERIVRVETVPLSSHHTTLTHKMLMPFVCWGAVPIGKVQLVRCSKALHHPITTLLTSPRGAMARSSLGEAGGGMGS